MHRACEPESSQLETESMRPRLHFALALALGSTRLVPVLRNGTNSVIERCTTQPARQQSDARCHPPPFRTGEDEPRTAARGAHLGSGRAPAARLPRCSLTRVARQLAVLPKRAPEEKRRSLPPTEERRLRR